MRHFGTLFFSPHSINKPGISHLISHLTFSRDDTWCVGAGCIYGGITRKWCHGTGYKYDGYHHLVRPAANRRPGCPALGQWEDRSSLFALGGGVSDQQRFRASPDNERILRESPEKLRHPHSHSHCPGAGRGCVSIMWGTWWQWCHGDQGLSDNDGHLMQLSCILFEMVSGTEIKWDLKWTSGSAAQVQANIKCSQSAYLQIWNRYLHWKVGITFYEFKVHPYECWQPT